MQLDINQANTETSNEVEFQSWSPIPAITYYYYNTNVPAGVPTPFSIIHNIKDVIGTPLAVGYNSFKMEVNRYGYQNSTPTWFRTDVLVSNVSVDTVIPLENGMQYTSNHQLLNFTFLSPGTYSAFMQFKIYGRKPLFNTWHLIETHIHEIRLIVSNELFTVSPSNLNFVHYAPTLPMASKELTVSGPTTWNLYVPSKFTLSTAESGVTISTLPGTFSGTVATSSGTKVLVIALSEDFNDDPPPSTLPGVFLLTKDTTVLKTVPFFINLLSIDEYFSIDPSELFFSAVKGFSEPEVLFVEANSISNDITFTCSPWLIVTAGQKEIDGVLKDGFYVTPISTVNMIAGNYNGFIDFMSTIEAEDYTISVAVFYELIGFITSPYNQDKAFTLDNKMYKLTTESSNSYFEVVQTIKTFDFFTDVEKETIIPEKHPLFNRNTEFNASLRIHRLMSRFEKPNDNYYQYIPAELVMSVKERAILDDEVIQETVLPIQKFVAGLSDNVTVPFSFLDMNPNIRRVTKSSYLYLNLLLPNEPVSLEIYKNGELISTVVLPVSLGKIVSYKVDFSAFNQGDVIKYKLGSLFPSFGQDVSKSFAVFPEGRYSNHVIWEDEFLLQSVLECTGSFNLKTDLQFTSQKTFKNLVEVLNHLEVIKESKFTISTGWIMKNDQITIESLMSTKRAWMALPNNQFIELRPLSKSIINIDSERELIDYTIEFQINRTNNAKTYSF